MRAELQDKEVLAMYDVRGIQSYIFKSNILIIVLPTIFMVDTLIVIEKIKQGVVKNGKENE